ncbi:ATP-binding cassette domain-containing protein [Pseudoflavonifractor capillosus]|uniref:ATP-binding cassette domain-containing protein n=1 Tax=Pseudoflavonifractor capillosus TaxID=106588 RepID=UPI00195BF502|nr:ATP-binding cassette domain-containing protein [Pseudoflavonifractor capillosus]MBM6694742.1 ATP-binding cassette domain-containing protein [Pseudoflavonifractor capillosus]
MIEGINLTKKFGDRLLFDNLSFTIETGEFVCFSGESGKGKTTLLNMIGQIEPPTSGQIRYDGKEVRTSRDRLAFLATKVGFIFQNFALVEGKTVSQNLEFVKKKNRQNISVEESLERVGLSDKLHAKVYTLSGGEQQRVALARLYIKKADIILADEPTGSLDRHNADLVMSILKDLNSQGKTIVLVTHDDAIKKRCNRIIEL